ncbi:PAS domain S-box protein [Moorena sp. SIO3A2]|uniref:sensor histidine kinase n=1 Tax=Moorena sp. SIO3A2 TaxID=2607841 RepID=UPI0013B8AC78|nr:PAS domain S-box protein [Moorena sp. SIO3A2]NER90785.1 PAS domain S-box protein [Moorena sp. SIO3A2]
MPLPSPLPRLQPPFWTGGVALVAMIFWIETLRQFGFIVPTPFILLIFAVALTASIDGLLAGVTSATVWAIYLIYASAVHFGPPSLTGGSVEVSLGILVVVLLAVRLGWIKDQNQKLIKKLRQASLELERRIEQRTAELLTANSRLAKEIRGRILAQEALGKNELALQLSHNRLESIESILSSLEDVVWSVRPQTSKLLYLNSAVDNLYGYSISDFLANSNIWLEVIHPEDRERVQQKRNFINNKSLPLSPQSLLAIDGIDLEYRIVRSDGQVRWIRDHVQIHTDAHGIPIRIDGIVTDITKAKQVEKALGESQRKFQAIFDQTSQFTWLLQPDGTLLEANQTALDFSGLTPSEIVGKPFWQIQWWTKSTQIENPLKNAIARAATGEFVRYQGSVLGLQGQVLTMEFSVKPLRDENGNIVLLILEGRDISDRIRAEAATLEAQNKDILLKEIHHRVKNNLQIVSGILYLQSRYIDDESILEIICESRNRLQVMALIHEKLYGSKNLSQLDFEDYIQSLTKDLLRSYTCSNHPPRIKVNFVKKFLDIDRAIPCGLIINELVSNALKHAFPEVDGGEIIVDFKCREDNYFELMVSDNGLGIREGIDLANPKTLGLRLVHTLATKQLKGELELDTSHGVMFKIKFS